MWGRGGGTGFTDCKTASKRLVEINRGSSSLGTQSSQLLVQQEERTLRGEHIELCCQTCAVALLD